MTSTQTRQYEMLARISKFGEARRALFPDNTEGGRAFATVAEVVRQLTSYSDSKSRTLDKGKVSKAVARQALLDRVRSIKRTVRVIARTHPAFAGPFKMPARGKPADQAILTAGRTFLEEASAQKERFVAFGMPETFVADLQRLVEAFDEAIRAREDGKEQKSIAQKGLKSALSVGLDAASALDVIVANQLGGDRDAMAAWEHDRTVEAPRRKRSRGEPPAATPPTPAVPPALSNTPAEAAAPVIADPKPDEAGKAA
jgi:hypothetical protein